MDYEYYSARTLGWLPSLLVILIGALIAFRSRLISRRGRWCLVTALALQSMLMLTLPVAKDAANMVRFGGRSWRALTSDVGPTINNFPQDVWGPFSFNQRPFPDPVPHTMPFIAQMPIHAEQNKPRWKEYQQRRMTRIIGDVIPDSLLTALIWGLIIIAMFDRPAPPKFLAEHAEPPSTAI